MNTTRYGELLRANNVRTQQRPVNNIGGVNAVLPRRNSQAQINALIRRRNTPRKMSKV